MSDDTLAKTAQHTNKRSFGDLISSHRLSRRKRIHLDEGQTLKEAVLSLISHHENLDVLISEATLRVRNKKEVNDAIPSVDGLYFALQTEAERTSTSVSSLTCSLCCKMISPLLKDKPNDMLMFTDKERALVIVIIDLLKKVHLCHGINRNIFIQEITRDNSLPIELVWRLHQSDIMSYTTYITRNLGTPNIIGALAQAIVKLSQCDQSCPNLNMRKIIVGDIMTFLVTQGYSDLPLESSASKGMKKVSKVLLHGISEKSLAEEAANPAFCLYEPLMLRETPVNPAFLQRYASRQITVLLSHNPNLKVSDAIRQQKDWTFAKTSSSLTEMYKYLMMSFSAEEIIRLIELTLEQQEVNWRTVLSFVATFLVFFSESPSLLQELISSLLQKTFEKCELDSLILCFVLARQGALEGAHVFPSYCDWFKKTFTASTQSPVMNKKSFEFLMTFLTNLVPYEEPAALRVHVLHPPSVPPKCHPLLADYIVLAKTRLADFKVSIEETSVCHEGSADKEKVQRQADQDVDKALRAFEKTGKVPAGVMQSSIIRKPYFIGVFLAALLKPRPLPDEPDLKMKLIDALHREDKIPTSMYNNYQKNCRKESAHLLEGIVSDEDESMEDLLLPASEQFENALTHLAEAVIKSHSRQTGKMGVAGQISILSEKIAGVLCSDVNSTESKAIKIDLMAPAFTKDLTQMASSVLQMICKVEVGLSASASHQVSWVRQVLAMLTRHRALWSALLYQLWVLITAQGLSLKPYHIQGLASIVLYLTSDVTLSSQVTVKLANKEGPYIDLLFTSIPCNTQQWMLFSLRFFMCFLQQAFRNFTEFSLCHETPNQAVISPEVVRKFQYLANRLVPETRVKEEVHEDTEDQLGDDESLCLTLYRSAQYQSLVKTISMPFSDWVALEIKVHSHTDAISSWQRFDYSQWMIQKYMGVDYEACAALCQTLARAVLDEDLIGSEEALVRRPSCTCPATVPPSRGDSRDHMLVLLQTLIPLLPPGETPAKRLNADDGDVTAAVPWLRRVWQERQEKLDAGEYSIARHVEHLAFIRLTRMLYPAYYSGRNR